VRLRADRLCYLSRQTRFSLVVYLTLSSTRSVTVLKHGHDPHAGLVQLLTSQCIECVDAESGQRIPVFSDTDQTTSKNSQMENPLLMSFDGHRSEYLTFTTASSPRDYELVFDPSELQPDRNYTIQFNPSALGWWSYDSKEMILAYFASHGKLPPPEDSSLKCESTNTVSFDTRRDLPQPPSVDVSLSAPSTLSLSGNPPFEFSVKFISHATKPITVLAERHRIKATESDFEILEDSISTRVAPDIIDDGDIEGPWQREDFLRLAPGVPCVEQRILNPTIAHSGLEDLEVDTDYTMRMPKSSWTWWSYDDVDEVMQYAGERGSSMSLGYAPPIDIVCYNEAKFHVVQ